MPFTYPTFFVAVYHKTNVIHRPDWYLVDRILSLCREVLHGDVSLVAVDDDLTIFDTIWAGYRSDDRHDFVSGADFRMDRFRSRAVLTLPNYHP